MIMPFCIRELIFKNVGSHRFNLDDSSVSSSNRAKKVDSILGGGERGGGLRSSFRPSVRSRNVALT
jgi:hypothetical protein